MHIVFRIVALTMLCAGTLSLAQQELSPSQLIELREDAERAYNEKDVATATALYLQLTELDRQNPEAWYGLSKAYEWSGELEQAILAAERAQSLGYVFRASLSFRVAKLHAAAGNQEMAIEWIAQSLSEGYRDRPSIWTVAAFSDLQDNPRFKQLAGKHFDDGVSRVDGLTGDLDYLVEEAQRLHADRDRPAFSEGFLDEVANVRRRISSSSDSEFLGDLMRLLAQLNDGHTGIYAPDPDSPLKIDGDILPFRFYVFSEGVFIIDSTKGLTDLVGNRVLKIGELSVEDTLERMSKFRGVDNPMTWKWMGPQFYLPRLQMLQIVGAVEPNTAVQLTLEDADGTITVRGIAGGGETLPRKLRPSPAAIGDVPLYLSNVDTAYWTQWLPQQEILYFQFNQVRDSNDQSLEGFADDLANELKSRAAKTLVIDVRHNNGGNNTLLQPLLKTLIGFESASSQNRIIVITGRNTFSAAQNFINRVEQWTDAMFVGEASASSPNFVGEETSLLLPYSLVRGSISNRYWQDSQPYDFRQWILPDIPIQPTAADYFAGVDAAMDAIYSLLDTKDPQ